MHIYIHLTTHNILQTCVVIYIEPSDQALFIYILMFILMLNDIYDYPIFHMLHLSGTNSIYTTKCDSHPLPPSNAACWANLCYLLATQLLIYYIIIHFIQLILSWSVEFTPSHLSLPSHCTNMCHYYCPGYRNVSGHSHNIYRRLFCNSSNSPQGINSFQFVWCVCFSTQHFTYNIMIMLSKEL